MKISVCMIVRDEEKNLARCLESLQRQEIFDEYVIVDTGSKDKTIEIAKGFGIEPIIPDDLDSLFVKTKYGEKINFSAARNYSIDQATGDWLFFIDADEEIVGTSLSRLPQFLELQELSTDGVAFWMVDIKRGRESFRFITPKCFRRGGVRYENIVHNRPVCREPVVLFNKNETTFYHYGYDLTEKQETAKRERTLGLLLKRLEDNPTDFQAYFYLAQVYNGLENWPRTIEYCIKYLRHKDKCEHFNPSIYFVLVIAAINADEIAIADQWLGEALKEMPDDLDCAMAGIEFGLATQKPHVAAMSASRFVENYDKIQKNPMSCSMRFIHCNKPEMLARALYYLTMIRLKEGFAGFTRLQESLKALPEETAADYREKIDAELAFANISIKTEPAKKKKAKATGGKGKKKK